MRVTVDGRVLMEAQDFRRATWGELERLAASLDVTREPQWSRSQFVNHIVIECNKKAQKTAA